MTGPPRVAVSALTGEGLDVLRTHLKTCMGYQTLEAGTVSARQRHLDALDRARRQVAEAERRLRDSRAGELVAEELRGRTAGAERDHRGVHQRGSAGQDLRQLLHRQMTQAYSLLALLSSSSWPANLGGSAPGPAAVQERHDGVPANSPGLRRLDRGPHRVARGSAVGAAIWRAGVRALGHPGGGGHQARRGSGRRRASPSSGATTSASCRKGMARLRRSASRPRASWSSASRRGRSPPTRSR